MGPPGNRILEHYDVVGAKAHHPRLKLKEIAKVDPAAAARIEAEAAQIYSPTRVDTLSGDPSFGHTLWHVPDAGHGAPSGGGSSCTTRPLCHLVQRAGRVPLDLPDAEAGDVPPR